MKQLLSRALLALLIVFPVLLSAQEVINTDVVIVGGGAAGLTCAVTILQGAPGTKIVVLEKNPFPGGSGNAGEGIFAVESPLQRMVNDPVTAEDAFRHEMFYGNHWQGNADLMRAFIFESGKTIEWFQEQGVKFERVGVSAPMEDNLRTWHLIDGRGKALIGVLVSKIKADPNATIMLGTPGKELITDSAHHVIGVVAEKSTGEKFKINAKAVVMATGGYAENPAMVAKYQDTGEPGKGAMVPFNKTGDGLKMAEAVGVRLEGMSHISWVGVVDPHKVPFTMSALGMEPSNLWVNGHGDRFCNEEIGRNFALVGNAVRRLGFAWSIFDETKKQDLIKRGPDQGVGMNPQAGVPMPKLDEQLAYSLKASTSVVEANSVEELAAKIHVPADRLKATFEEYNHAAETGYDARYMKPHSLLRTVKGHLYALKMEPYYMTTLGGASVTGKLEAVDKNFDVIPGLYIIGADAYGGIFGDTYSAEAPGSTYGFAVNSGRLAGKAIAENLRSKAVSASTH
jgi:fumarate reductase flavoprotein subunit